MMVQESGMESSGKCRFQCPGNFEPVAECNGGVTSEPDTEIWLIKAPADFTPESFNSHRLPLSGYKMQKVKAAGTRRFYHVMSSPSADTPLRAFLHQQEAQQDRLACAPPFQGIITVAEAHGDPSAVHSIPDRPPLTIPEGLKQRYQPFGALPPRMTGSSGGVLQSSGSSKKKKKAKKRKHQESQD
ncbi:DNA-directed RNA polymerase I subunit RPA34 [Hyperolius riggenbachi]|uniref:DNA-directed RNA polymerase I subunit RPA34 n=1 Tax=Hyperolius riggenbachi TaxID=752182 RepID=UPI0035A3A4E1